MCLQDLVLQNLENTSNTSSSHLLGFFVPDQRCELPCPQIYRNRVTVVKSGEKWLIWGKKAIAGKNFELTV